ncbi:hypothetical protein GKQ77_01745 [Streptomyces sp. BG9H]|uniref:Polyprenyl synthetase n=1 Tax=Streptomyces anatolicus TaxID=2675858 RepID=A0ABS6YGU0_9ACTN|nr:hypothetical protein [Streptomyces anatolicus]MBW5420294.1 hypothetical protein [Streptomyces anatolicus]
MPETIDLPQADEALRRVLAEPSLAAQILLVTARLLGESTDTLGMHQLDRRLTTAIDAICGALPEAVRTDAATRARSALPPLTSISCGRYAAHLRAAAREL